MSKTTKIGLVTIIVGMFFYFWLRGTLFLDPDFGWHLRMGELILHGGIPATDPFSYTMPSYPVVRHEWLTEIFMVKVMDSIGYTGLGALFSLVAVLAFSLQIFTLSPKAKPFAWVFLLAVFIAVSGLQGIRTQVVTWLFFSGVLFILRDVNRLRQFGPLLPLFFAIWVNLHGGFAIGILVLFLAGIYWWYKIPEKRLWVGSIFLLSLAATFITPYGYRSWWEVWMTISSSNLHWNIQEWIPTIFVPSLPFWFVVVFSLIFVNKYRKQFSFLDQMLYGLLFLHALSGIRHVPLWLLLALPMTVEAVSYFYHDITKIKYAQQRFRKMASLFFMFVILFFVVDLRGVAYALGFLGNQGMFPVNAVKYLSTHQTQGQIFALYDWGGYLIWKLPQKKVFIDGRMPAWRRDEVIAGESNNAFVDYQNFLDGTTSFAEVVEKYAVDTLFLPLPEDTPVKDPFENTTLHVGKNILHLPLRRNVGSSHLIAEAKKAGWVIVYQDETAVIYSKR